MSRIEGKDGRGGKKIMKKVEKKKKKKKKPVRIGSIERIQPWNYLQKL